ncbi:hypothetical protein IQ238_16645 [Pleurocapsales cyanobacterium LEGE 06147]|nr:hypothetical protein [Pleurocapsales cyanobacterium LEGE 06147]
MKIQQEDYSIVYDAVATTVVCQGSLRLNGTAEYSPIIDLLNDVVEQEPSHIILNLRELKFLNSTGISMLSKFVINVRNRKNIQMIVIGSQEISWQSKFLKNLQRLMPSLQLKLT